MVAEIRQEAIVPHCQFRFVTIEAVARLLNVHPEQLKEIRCWANVMLVIGQNISKFVSYADLPPILGVEPPAAKDILRWRKRWHKTKTHKAPAFWVQFYAQKFQQATSLTELQNWRQLVRSIQFGLDIASLQSLQNLYSDRISLLQTATVSPE